MKVLALLFSLASVTVGFAQTAKPTIVLVHGAFADGSELGKGDLSALFTAGVAAVVLGVLGGTTWLSGGLWAPHGGYSRFISPLLLVVWVLMVSRVLLTRSPATRAAW